ncbi:MAG: DMT family transporter [Acidimicrobiia bacterium]
MAEHSTVRHPVTWLPYAAVTLALLGWACGPLFVNSIDASAQAIVLWRTIIAVPIMVAVAYATGGRIDLKLLRAAVPAGICFGLSFITSYESFRKTSIAAATLIPSLQPALILIFAGLLFGERRTRRELGLALVAFAGISAVVLTASAGTTTTEGNLYAAGNLLVFTAFFLLSKHLRNRDVHAWSLLAAVFIVTLVVVAPWALLTGDDLGAIHGVDWVWVLGLVFLSGLMGHGLMTWSHRYLDVTITSTLTLANPVLATIGAWIVFDQTLNPEQVAGIVVTLVALGFLVRGQTRDVQLASEAAFGGDLLDEVVAEE